MAVRSVKEPESMLEAVNMSVTEAVKTGKEGDPFYLLRMASESTILGVY